MHFSKFILLLLLISISSVFSYGQFKKAKVVPGFEADKRDLINPDFQKKVKETSENTLTGFEIKTMDFITASSVLRTGLKAGILNENGVPVFIEGQLSSNLQRRTTTEGKALDYLYAAAPLMKIANPESEFMLKESYSDELGMQHVKMQQIYKQIPVYASEIIIHGDHDYFDFLNGSYHPTFHSFDVTPVLDETAARTIMKNDLGEWIEYEQDVFEALNVQRIQSELVIYVKAGVPYLTWHHTVYKNIIDKWEYFVDAKNGDIIHKFLNVCKLHNHKGDASTNCDKLQIKSIENVNTSAFENNEISLMDGSATATAQDLFNINRIINTYQVGTRFYLIDAARDIFSSTSNMPNSPVGVLWTINAFNTAPQKDNFRYDHVSTTNNTWNDKTAVSAHYNSGKSFEYFRNVHNRKSINGNSGNVISFINVAEENGASMGNAFWNGAAIFYGNGDNAFLPLARGLDVAGHEMTHGVIQSTSNLEYQGESGALNESFSDVFGVMIDRDDWLIGEDVVRTNAFPSGALRNMENPHNGASTNDFNRGWQPKHYNERFTGTGNNGGVHINSGIPNHAFFKFATAIGKNKAERVYYRALTTYLTKSSKFVDCRVAVIKAATDLHGANSPEVTAAGKAFDEVGILGSQGGDYEVDVPENTGTEFILSTPSDFKGVFLQNGTQSITLSNREVWSKPSISDDGTEIVYVAVDNHIYNIVINWSPFQVQEFRLSNTPIWRNAVISKDGRKIAALTLEEVNEIIVFNFGTTVTDATFELFNPTFTQGVNTGDVLYADFLEFDHSGEFVMYDAFNEIKSNESGEINYWDIGFIKVWNNASGTFSLGSIEKLFASLPNNVSVGNSTFSKNSPHIIAFDYIEDEDNLIVAANIERGELNLLFENNTLASPSYSIKDDRIIFDNEGPSAVNLGVMSLKDNKIEINGNPAFLLANRRWASFFSNGTRILSSNSDIFDTTVDFKVHPNPTNDYIHVSFNNELNRTAGIQVFDINGNGLFNETFNSLIGKNLKSVDIRQFPAGIYFVQLNLGEKSVFQKIVKL